MRSPLSAWPRGSWRRRAWAFVGSAAIVVASGCGGEDTDTATVADERPVVVVTTNILADVVGELGGADIDVVDVMPRGADPHSFGLSAREAETIYDADLIVTNGLGLEAGLTDITSGAAADGVALLDVGAHVVPEAGSAEVGSIDPHIWTDPTMMISMNLPRT